MATSIKLRNKIVDKSKSEDSIENLCRKMRKLFDEADEILEHVEEIIKDENE